jgi:hypothetical protein
MYPPTDKSPIINETVACTSVLQSSFPPKKRATDECRCAKGWKITDCCSAIIPAVGRLTWLYAPEEEGENNRFCVHGERNRELILCACKCPVNPYPVVQKTLRTVEITHLEAVNGRRASLDIALVNANVHLRVDQRPHGINVGFRKAQKSAVRRHVRWSMAERSEPVQTILRTAGLP